MFIRERTPLCLILYGVYLVFEGLSLRAASRALRPIVSRSHVAVWKWLQGLAPLEHLFRPSRVRCFLVDETMVKVHGEEGWVWAAYEPHQRRFLALWFSWTRSSMTAEAFLRRLVTRYGRHRVYTDGGTWYPEACEALGLEHRPLDPVYRNLVERAVQRLKDRTEAYDDHFPCRKERCRLTHVQNWLSLFSLHQQPEYLNLVSSTALIANSVQKLPHAPYLRCGSAIFALT